MATTSEHTPTPLNPLVVKAITAPKSLSEAEIVSLATMVMVQPAHPVEPTPKSS